MYYVIVNPASKSGHGREIWARLEQIFIQRGIPYRAFFSRGVGHVTRLAARLTSEVGILTGFQPLRLIILGGDGTLNEALQGISEFDRVELGYIPTGSSNDLARDLQLPGDPAAILDTILSGRIRRRADLGILTYGNTSAERSRLQVEAVAASRYFAVSSGIGFDAAVCEEALSSHSKNVLNRLGLGKLTYLAIALKQLIAARHVSCDIYLDGTDRPLHLEQVLFAAFMIRKYEGGGFKFCPAADAADGRLDLCVVGKIPKALILAALPTAFWGKHYIFPSIRHYTAASVRFEASHPLWVHTDGEVYLKSSSITISCLPGKLTLMM